MTLKTLLLIAPPDQLNKNVLPFIKKWNDTPTAMQILEVLDMVKMHNYASKFTIKMIQSMYDVALLDENLTHEQAELQAKWRK